MIDPIRSTVVAWYDELPDALARLVARVQGGAAAALGAAFTAREPAQVHATLIGLERAPRPFDLEPLAAHLQAVLARPLTIQFGGFPPTDRRLLSQGRPLHERGFSIRDGRAVLMGWPVDDGGPSPVLADIRQGCAAFGVTHRYGLDPDVYLVVGDVTGTDGAAPVEGMVRAELAAAAVTVPLSMGDLCLVTYDDPALPRSSTTSTPLSPAAADRSAVADNDRPRSGPPHRGA